jgi:hypothetical protein
LKSLNGNNNNNNNNNNNTVTKLARCLLLYMKSLQRLLLGFQIGGITGLLILYWNDDQHNNNNSKMGIFSRFRKQVQPSLDDVSSSSSFSYLDSSLLDGPEVQSQLAFFVVVVAMLLSLRLLTTTKGSSTQTLSGQHVLNIHNLNDVVLIKEVFMAYLNAAILEPILSIGSLEAGQDRLKVITNLFELLSLCWWVWLVTDAFDCNDVMFQYK